MDVRSSFLAPMQSVSWLSEIINTTVWQIIASSSIEGHTLVYQFIK